MVSYEISINSKLDEKLRKISEHSGVTVVELLSKIINNSPDDILAEEAIAIYKEGKMKIRAAWKLSGLSYQDFIDRAQR